MRASHRRLRTLVWRGEAGVGLVEVLVATTLLALTLVTFLSALSAASIGVGTTEERVTAETLARSQLEYTKSLPYQPPPAMYATVTPPAGFSVSASASGIAEGDNAVELITVTVSRGGNVLLTIEDYKVDR